jgi:hypothetical protein
MKPSTFARVARAWAAHCKRETLFSQTPIAVVLLSALGHSLNMGHEPSGDVLRDILIGVWVVVDAWQRATERGPSRTVTLDHHEVADIARRLWAVIELRKRERADEAGGAR